MRDLIDILDKILIESPNDGDELAAMKSVIAAKIKSLPDDDATAKALREIEDLLKHTGFVMWHNEPVLILATHGSLWSDCSSRSLVCEFGALLGRSCCVRCRRGST